MLDHIVHSNFEFLWGDRFRYKIVGTIANDVKLALFAGGAGNGKKRYTTVGFVKPPNGAHQA